MKNFYLFYFLNVAVDRVLLLPPDYPLDVGIVPTAHDTFRDL